MERKGLDELTKEKLVELVNVLLDRLPAGTNIDDIIDDVKARGLADALHTALCSLSHPNECAFYTEDDWKSPCRTWWVLQAIDLLKTYQAGQVSATLAYIYGFVGEAAKSLSKQPAAEELIRLMEECRTLSSLINTYSKGAENAKQLARADAEGLGGDQTGGKLPL